MRRECAGGVAVLLLILATPLFGGTKYLHAVKPVKDSYIVQIAPDVASQAEEAVLRTGAKIADRFPLISALLVQMNERQAAKLADIPGILVVEEDAWLEVAATQSGNLNVVLNTYGNPATLWGLDRIDQRTPAYPRVDNSYTWCYDGSGVRIYIVDTGIQPAYGDIAGRVDSAPTLKQILAAYPTNDPRYLPSQNCWNDPNYYDKSLAGHGTAVATIAGGTVLGVAKGATLVDARANDCGGSGNTSRMLRVLQWICTEDPNRGDKSVINISSASVTRQPDGGALNAQITVAVDTYNIPVVTAAGNYGYNAFWYWPGNSLRAINVGGLNQSGDSMWAYSNYGYNIEFYAPAQFVESGSMILATPPAIPRDQYRSETSDCNSSLLYPADTCTSGTSFAAPYVAGIVARYKQRYPSHTRDTIVNALKQTVISNGGPYVLETPTGYYIPIVVYTDCMP